MVPSYDLNRYEPPLEYLLGRLERLARLLEEGVGASYVRLEMRELLRELAAYARARTSFPALERKVRAASAVDAVALEAALEMIENAPKDKNPPVHDPAKTLETLRNGIGAIKNNQHRWPLVETVLRLEIGLEGWFLDGLISVSDAWDYSKLVDLIRAKVAHLAPERQMDLWSQVIHQFDDVDDPALEDYRLRDHGVLPKGFLVANVADVTDRLSLYIGWLRARVIRAMLLAGRRSYPIPAVGIAKILASTFQLSEDEPTATELVIARSIGNIAGWIALRNGPLTLEQFASLIGISADSRLLAGEEKREFQEAPDWKGSCPELAAIHSCSTIATAVSVIHEYESPMGAALFQYKAGIELFAPTIAAKMSKRELDLQKELCKFLLERGIFTVGTKFGQNETDLVAKVRDEYVVIECKVLKKKPSAKALQKNVNQLLRYDALNPAFRGRRAILVLYNFSSEPIDAPRGLVDGRTWIVAINAKPGPPSATKTCLVVTADHEGGVRCRQLAGED